MKVLFLTREYPPFDVGGIAKHTENLVRALKKLGVISKVLSFGDSNYSSEEIKFLDPRSSIIYKTESPVTEDAKIPYDILRFTQAANKMLRNEAFDILHVQEPYVGAFVKHPKKVTTIHDTGYGEVKPLLAKFTDFANLKRIGFYVSLGFFSEIVSAFTSLALVVPFQHVKDELVEFYKIPEEKISVIYSGVELPIQHSTLDKSAAKRKMGLSDSVPMIFTAARHIPRKRIETLVRAAALLKKRMDIDFFVKIAGDGPSRSNIDKLIKNLNLSGVVRTEGWISPEQLYLSYAAADIFVLTSEYETGPISLLEAMAYGDSVVSSEIDGFPKLIKNGEEGLLFPVGDYASLSSHLKTLITDDGKREKMALSARHFAEFFNWDSIARKTLNLYRSIL